MTDRNLNDLHPLLEPICKQFIAECQAVGLNAIVTETWRDPAREDQLHAQGITAARGDTCKHCFMLGNVKASKAFDFAILDEQNRMVEAGTDERYSQAGLIAGKLGLLWGGNFHRPDYDHCEIP